MDPIVRRTALMIPAISGTKLRPQPAFFVTVGVLLANHSDLTAEPIAPEKYIEVRTGELPIILSAPHGGLLEFSGVPPRNTDGVKLGPSGVVVKRDGGTEELLRIVAKRIEARLGKKPYFVLSRLHRRYMDPNRPAEIAFDSQSVAPVYRRYHNELSKACQDVFQRFGNGLLLDIHGQSTRADTVYRGTSNGRTVELLRQRFGEAAHIGDDSLFGLFRTRGWRVDPDPLGGREQSGFTGGYIVRTYGSHQGTGIDAMQLEFGGDYRKANNRDKTADVLVDAVVEYSKRYLAEGLGRGSK